MKEKISAFVSELIIYDYILFGVVFALFVLFMVLSIILRHKTILASFFMLLSFTILFIAPVIGYEELHTYLFKNTIKLTSQKKLNFTKAVVVKGVLKNETSHPFKSCKITAYFHKVSKNKIKNYIYKFKSFQNMSMVKGNIKAQESVEFKMIVEPFTYLKGYNISLKARCR